jgi:hypothetical protein
MGAVDERWQRVRLWKNEGEAGDCFLTLQRCVGQRESGGGGGDGEDGRRQPEFEDGGGGLGWGR